MQLSLQIVPERSLSILCNNGSLSRLYHHRLCHHRSLPRPCHDNPLSRLCQYGFRLCLQLPLKTVSPCLSHTTVSSQLPLETVQPQPPYKTLFTALSQDCATKAPFKIMPLQPPARLCRHSPSQDCATLTPTEGCARHIEAEAELLDFRTFSVDSILRSLLL